MDRILYQYQQLDRTQWVYIASLMAVALYFKFSRFWSVRNLDVVGLIALAPGVLLMHSDSQYAHLGFAWMFAVGGLFLIRLLVDPMMVRRPLLEPNLLPGALTFMTAALYLFLMGHLVNQELRPGDWSVARRADELWARHDSLAGRQSLAETGPALPLLCLIGRLPSAAILRLDAAPDEDITTEIQAASVRSVTILSHLAIVVGMTLIGMRHFRNLRTGIAAAGLYLLLPYTAITIGRIHHALPAALLVWAVLCYHRPLIAGVFLGLASGAIYYPIFLAPLWAGFYWQRGLVRFLLGLAGVKVLLLASLVLTSYDAASYFAQLREMTSWLNLTSTPLSGFWMTAPPDSLLSIQPVYRVTVFALFGVLCGSFALWPAQKNLGTLLSCSAAVMLATQFWIPQDGGIYVTWYLPLLLLTVLRPNLEDRVALSVLGSGWLGRKRAALAVVERAA